VHSPNRNVEKTNRLTGEEMTIASTSAKAVRSSPWRVVPLLAALLAAVAVVLLALVPIGWRAGWWQLRFSLLTLMPWVAYFGIAALVLSVIALLLGRSRIGWSGIAIAVAAFAASAATAYVPLHYDQIRQSVPPIHDITTDTENPPAFAAVVAARNAEGGNPVAYEGAKIAEQQKRAYPDIAPLIFALPPDRAFSRALDTVHGMGWTIVTADPTTGRIEASDRSRWMGFTDDIVIRVAAKDSGSRIDVRSSSRLGRSDFGVNATRIRSFLAALRADAGGPG
jgi:uncharacterized protein (DUF1499 family)